MIMLFKNKIISCYLTLQSCFFLYQRYINFYLLGFKELKTFPVVFLPSFRLFIFNILTSIIKNIEKIRGKIDINVEKIHITKVEKNIDRAIILDKKNIETESITFNDINKKLGNTLVDYSMISRVFTNFYLINSDDDKICLKSLITKYKDLDGKCDHTLQNILIFNNIPHLEDSFIYIKYYKDGKFLTYKESLKEVYNKHINYFINF